jgi:hypothetical protein
MGAPSPKATAELFATIPRLLKQTVGFSLQSLARSVKEKLEKIVCQVELFQVVTDKL